MKTILERVIGQLPRADEVNDAEALGWIGEILEAQAGMSRSILRFDDGRHEPLPADMQPLWRALVHVECVADLMSQSGWDGLHSIFINCVGERIEHHRIALQASDGALSALFEEAYQLAAPGLGLELEPLANWGMRNPGGDPDALLDPAGWERIAALDEQIEAMRDAVYARAVAAYKAAAPH